MKRLYLSLAVILCLVLCVFAFAACGKKKPSETTAQTNAETTAETTAADTSATGHVHVPGDAPFVDLEPSCTEPGVQAYYCVECDARMNETQDVALSSAPVFVGYDDAIWTCGDGFVRNVKPAETPVAATITLADGVTVPATIYFQFAD